MPKLQLVVFAVDALPFSLHIRVDAVGCFTLTPGLHLGLQWWPCSGGLTVVVLQWWPYSGGLQLAALQLGSAFTARSAGTGRLQGLQVSGEGLNGPLGFTYCRLYAGNLQGQ